MFYNPLALLPEAPFWFRLYRMIMAELEIPERCEA
jgi:hypothetical protein